MPGARHAGGRPRKDGLDRAPLRHFRAHQGAVPLDHEHGRVDAVPPQHFFEIQQQAGDPWDDLRVQHGRDRPGLKIERVRKFMAAGDEEPGFLLDTSFDPEFVIGIDGPGKSRHGEGGHGVMLDHAARDGPDFVLLDRHDFPPRDVQLPPDHRFRPVRDVVIDIQPEGGHEEETDLLPLVFDDGVGGQGGGQGNQSRAPQQCPVELLERLAYAHGEIAPRGQGFGLAEGAVPPEVEQDRVGIGAAGIHAQSDCDVAAVVQGLPGAPVH